MELVFLMLKLRKWLDFTFSIIFIKLLKKKNLSKVPLFFDLTRAKKLLLIVVTAKKKSMKFVRNLIPHLKGILPKQKRT